MQRAPILVLAALAGSVLASGGLVQHTVSAQFAAERGLSEWDLDGGGRWRMRDGVLALEEAGVPAGPIRRPGAMAIFRSPPVGTVTLDVELRSTAPNDLLVRDVLLIVGYQTPTRLYYVHLSARTDDVHNGIFLVYDADRRRIDRPDSRARLIDQAWHRVRLERNVETGAIRVFFDDDPEPMLSANDRTIRSGRVGVGSFDETAEFRAFRLRF